MTTPPSEVILSIPTTWFLTARGPFGASSAGHWGFSRSLCIFAIISRLRLLAFWLIFFAYENLLSLLLLLLIYLPSMFSLIIVQKSLRQLPEAHE